ncbi:MAG: OsmC family protein [Alphaproteobacteria bacterium]|nr:OsmC family protein [Alphaproteobacteria bacterium]
MTETVVTVEENGQGLYTQDVKTTHHHLIADEPADIGGSDRGPAPYELLLAALGACTSMTVRMYARQKQWDLQRVAVRLTHKKEPDAENKKRDVISRDITVEGGLDEAQRQKLLEIANKCPLHRTLMEPLRPAITSSISGK